MIATTTVDLNLRAEGSMSAEILFTIPVYSKVTVLKRGVLWSHVRYQDMKGYCASQYLNMTEGRLISLENTVNTLTHDISQLGEVFNQMTKDIEVIKRHIELAIETDDDEDIDQDFITQVQISFFELNQRIERHEDDVWDIKHVFYTLNGNWDLGKQDSPFSIQKVFRDLYLKPVSHPHYFDDAGADNHILALALDQDGNYAPETVFTQSWPTGSDSRSAVGDMKHSGWVNWPIGRNVYYPDEGQEGPFSVTVAGEKAPILHGIGLPYALHVSTFVVFQRIG